MLLMVVDLVADELDRTHMSAAVKDSQSGAYPDWVFCVQEMAHASGGSW
jgi:hypothetical protein